MTAALERPPVRLPPPPSAPEVAELERTRRRAAALAFLADRGVTAAGQRHAELVAWLEQLERHVASAADVAQALTRARAALVGRIPFSLGGVVICDGCGQVGEAVELVAHRLRWRWTGRTVDDRPVSSATVLQARDVGDVPPGCPDCEARAVAAGILERHQVLELERRALR